jgi:hypothetical protein
MRCNIFIPNKMKQIYGFLHIYVSAFLRISWGSKEKGVNRARTTETNYFEVSKIIKEQNLSEILQIKTKTFFK